MQALSLGATETLLNHVFLVMRLLQKRIYSCGHEIQIQCHEEPYTYSCRIWLRRYLKSRLAFQTAGNCKVPTTFTNKRSLPVNRYFHRVQAFIQVRLVAEPFF